MKKDIKKKIIKIQYIKDIKKEQKIEIKDNNKIIKDKNKRYKRVMKKFEEKWQEN